MKKREDYLKGAVTLRRSTNILFIALAVMGAVIIANISMVTVPSLIQIPKSDIKNVLFVFIGGLAVVLIGRFALWIFGREVN